MKGAVSNHFNRSNAPHRLIESEMTHSHTRRCYLSCYSNHQPNRHNRSRSKTFHHSSPHQLNGGEADRARTLMCNSYLVRHPHQRKTRSSHHRRRRRNRK